MVSTSHVFTSRSTLTPRTASCPSALPPDPPAPGVLGDEHTRGGGRALGEAGHLVPSLAPKIYIWITQHNAHLLSQGGMGEV